MDVSRPPIDDYLYVMGHPSQAELLRFLRTRAVESDRLDMHALEEEWQRARTSLSELRASGHPDRCAATAEPLPPEFAAIASEIPLSAGVERALHFAPRRWAWVALDSMVIYQRYLNLHAAQALAQSLPTPLSARHLMDIATGRAPATPTVRVTRTADNTWYFSSASADLRFLDVLTLDPASISGREASGTATQVLGIYVGFGINFLSAFRVRDRIVLQNGTHRAYALRARGITHVPCWLADASDEEAFEIIVPAEVKANRAVYLDAARPPLFRDYFDAALCKVIKVARSQRLLEVQLTFKQSDVPALSG